MKPKEFVTAYLQFAMQTQIKTGISAIAILCQCAWESGWGRFAPGNMMFGVKDTDGLNGNEQLITTSEFSSRINCQPKDLGLVSIISVTPVMVAGTKKFKYIGKAYFRKYNTPEESFTDHANFFQKNKRYSEAWKVREDPEAFIQAIATAGYATDPLYAKNLLSIMKTIKSNL